MSADSPKEHAQWEARLLGLALRQVLLSYRENNAALFGDRLKTPQLRWSEAEGLWGAWRAEERVLELSLRLLERPWGDLLEVLKHEMAHQYVDEVLGVRGEGPHGPCFQEVCRERGIDARTAGDPSSTDHFSSNDAGAEEGSERHNLLRRVQHLFSLAQSENPHEAEAAMKAAQRLMLKYNLEAAVQGAKAGYCYRHLGRPTGRRMAWQRLLGSILSEHFFVEVIIVPVYRPKEAKRGSVLEACGSPANLEIAAYVHDFLDSNARRLWAEHQKLEGASGTTEKNSFLYGVMKGFSDKLGAEKQRSQKEGLVYVGDPALREFLRARHPYVRSVSGGSRLRKDAFSAGHQAGGRIVLHRGVSAGQSGGPVRRLGTGERH